MCPLQILLAEDNPGDVLLVAAALEEHHIEHELKVAHDGEEALAFFAHMGQPDSPPCPDLVLLDLNLPRLDGFEILTEFRKHPLCGRTPVIVVSSSDTPTERRRMAELGVVQYFQKPGDLDAYMKLGAIVRATMSERANT
jgi:two-component system, chemotaxis family, response regulator Rcp1